MRLGEFMQLTLKAHDCPGTPPPAMTVERVFAIVMWVGRDVLRSLKDR
jgi:hypothetical protein